MLSTDLLDRADTILKEYESGNKKCVKENNKIQLSFDFEDEKNDEEIIEKINKINPLEMTPIEALNYLYDLKMSIKK